MSFDPRALSHEERLRFLRNTVRILRESGVQLTREQELQVQKYEALLKKHDSRVMP